MVRVPATATLTERPLRIGHLASADFSLFLLLRTELEVDLASGAEVFALSAPGTWAPHLRSLGVEPVHVPSLSRSWDLGADTRAAKELYRALRQLDLDVLHTHMPKAGVLGRVVGRVARVPVIVNTCHGLWAREEDPLLLRCGVTLVEALAAQLSDFELYQNADDERALRWAVPPQRRAYVGNGVDLTRFRFDEEGRTRVREEWGIGEDEILVGAVGRVLESKGVLVFAEVAERLAYRARFAWVGASDEGHPDAVDVRSEAVRFVGLREDMVDVLSALDVFVHPSFAREGLSRASMEAAAVGRPIVLTDIKGCREIGRPFRDLLLVRPRSADDLEAALSLLLEDPGLRARLGEAARRRSLDAFDQRGVATRSLDVYARVAKKGGRRTRNRRIDNFSGRAETGRLLLNRPS
ncbi:MAG: glycosyltransferase [Actinomycetota bacterium]